MQKPKNLLKPRALVTAVANTGAPSQVANAFNDVPASGALFAAFLGYNPIGTLLQSMGSVAEGLPQNTLNVLLGPNFFPNAIASPFMSALTEAFIIGALLCFLAAAFSGLRGKKTDCAV
jgi:hypothetical protein